MQRRDNGNPYLTEHIYPTVNEVLNAYSNSQAQEDGIVCALLHDTIEDDPNFTPALCKRQYGARVTKTVTLLTKTQEENQPSRNQAVKMQQNESYIKRILDGPQEAIIIKLADRLTNLASTDTIRFSRPQKYARYIAETEKLFLPLAAERSPYLYERLKVTLEELKASRIRNKE